MNKNIVIFVLMLMLGAGCSNNKVTVGSAVGGTTGALVGGMIGGMFGLLVTGAGNTKNSDTVIAASVILGGVTGGAAGVALGSGIQSAIDKQ